jgi:hypothetical protein
MGFLDGTVLDDEGISLRSIAPKDGSAIKGQVKSVCKFQIWVCKKANLKILSIMVKQG